MFHFIGTSKQIIIPRYIKLCKVVNVSRNAGSPKTMLKLTPKLTTAHHNKQIHMHTPENFPLFDIVNVI
jgi:hypothetical protein